MSLRSRVLRGGVHLALRQGMGMVISLAGMFLITLRIGPEQYGVYAAAFGSFYYLQSIAQLGLTVYMVRWQHDQPSPATKDAPDNATKNISEHQVDQNQQIYDQGFTLLLLVSLIGIVLSQFTAPLLASWVKLAGFQPIFQMLCLSLPVVLLTQVPMAKLERELNYQQVAWIELIGQLAYFWVALPVALNGGGAWAPAIGWWAQQLHLLILFFWAAKYTPRLCWQPRLIVDMLRYSVSYSASFWVWQLRALVNPLLVGRFLGAETVGYIALATRMVELLGFVKAATYRLSIAALARLQGNRDRMTQAITEGMALQVLALGPILAVVSWVGPIAFPLLGAKWIPTMQIFPFIAASLLINALFNLHSSALYALQRNWQVTAFHVIHIAIFFGCGALLIPRMGIIGFGWAEIATILSYAIIHFYLINEVDSPNYRFAGLLAFCFGLALFPYQVGWWVVLVLAAALLWPQTQQQLFSIWYKFRSAT
jgi:O-antigen/teichoic acid export membrane protein